MNAQQAEIRRLHSVIREREREIKALLMAARPYVATCADDDLPNPAADVLRAIDENVKK